VCPCIANNHACVGNCGMNRGAYVRTCGEKSHTFEEKLKGVKTNIFWIFCVFMSCDGLLPMILVIMMMY
jgi:hypothetical protein